MLGRALQSASLFLQLFYDLQSMFGGALWRCSDAFLQYLLLIGLVRRALWLSMERRLRDLGTLDVVAVAQPIRRGSRVVSVRLLSWLLLLEDDVAGLRGGRRDVIVVGRLILCLRGPNILEEHVLGHQALEHFVLQAPSRIRIHVVGSVVDLSDLLFTIINGHLLRRRVL